MKKTTPVATATTRAAKPTAPAKKSAQKYDGTLARTKILSTLEAYGKGKIFSITANTKETENRVFTGRLTAPKSVTDAQTSRARTGRRRGAPNVASIGMLRMWDMINKGWRTVNLQEVTMLKAGGKVLRVR